MSIPEIHPQEASTDSPVDLRPLLRTPPGEYEWSLHDHGHDWRTSTMNLFLPCSVTNADVTF